MKFEYRYLLLNLILQNSLTNKANPFHGSKVEDAVYELEFINGAWCLKNKSLIQSANPIYTDNIIVILESPHIDEFNPLGQGTMPLKNDTYFVQMFETLFKNSINLSNQNVSLNPQTKYSVYLVNAIQYQCSLGLPTNYYRDYIFLYFWETLYSDFETRLKKIVNNKTLAILNLCTKGSHKNCRTILNILTNQWEEMYKNCGISFMKKLGFSFPRGMANSLQDLVGQSVAFVAQKIPYTTGTHPSIWCYNAKID